ncbi:fungal specific transcription factor domain-containing protein [Aspergillus niger CBS 101883]|uniref:fungal specific transcription factor domain-containing protein n=1 Tax=Aspergillus lacticoffeatus (strain CBS 101883) TaxID=1450533 RepID=UPI000D7FDAA2|nr:uncharacterized protein BO96DRAFT_468947 [Aspergillus niger CBS 101883]PYH52977.1 hypothetical protein BO96DRAFT_468947 [Aspergillus niger CBS 101883]
MALAPSFPALPGYRSFRLPIHPIIFMAFLLRWLNCTITRYQNPAIGQPGSRTDVGTKAHESLHRFGNTVIIPENYVLREDAAVARLDRDSPFRIFTRPIGPSCGEVKPPGRWLISLTHFDSTRQNSIEPLSILTQVNTNQFVHSDHFANPLRWKKIAVRRSEHVSMWRVVSAGTERLASDTSGLLSRVKELESQLKSFARSPHASRRASTSADGALNEHSTSPENYDRRSSFTLYSPTSIPEGGAAHHPVKTDGVDGMGVITLSDSATFSSYFGPSSNVALVYELTRVLKNLSGAPVNLVNPRAEGVEASHNQQSNVTTSPSLIPRAMTAAGAHNLPPEPEATSLLHEYFDTIGLFFPCIYRDTFLAKYRDFRRNDSSPASRSWQALLFVMFAVMYQMRSFASPTDAEDKLSWEFLQKALNLAMPEALQSSATALSPDLLSSMFDKFSSDMVLSCACCQGSQYKPDGTNATETLSLLKNSGFSTIKKCMYTCSGGVALAKTIVDEQFLPTSLWGAWWMTNFLVFNASMMHFGMLLISTQSSFSGLMATEDIDLILSDLKDASEVHRRLNRNNLIISHCRECLHNFLDLYKSFRDTTSPKGIGAWEDLTLSLQQPEFENTHGSQTATSSILPNLEQNSVWFDMEAFPGPMA